MKKSTFFILVITACCVVVGGLAFVRESGLFKKRPDPKYLSSEEEALRPVYRGLSRKEQAVYEALYRGACRYEEKIPLPYELSGEDYGKIYCLLEKQEGELFQLDSTYYTAQKVREATIVYRFDENDFEQMKNDFDAAVVKGLEGLSRNSSDLDKASRIHDYLIRTCRYVETEDTGLCATAYGCLVNKRANCEGYSKAFGVLCSKVGLETILVTGTADPGGNHAWNQVKINGKWYNMDVTWDDPDVQGDVRTLYFLCDDEEFYRSHTPDREYFEPFPCSGDNASYYKMNDQFAETAEEGGEILFNKLKEGANEIEIKFASEDAYDEFKSLYIDQQKAFGVIYEAGRDSSGELKVSARENRQELHIEFSVYP